ncbi:TPA: hypothetical protein NK775_001726 [Serratia marcescens]|uniref:hypothetical protein n=1 Tax=Serratia nevei TaxID=2703794 RepID=UPI00313E9FBD|nr:hypothetical protein [Serratia marcescens]
MKKLLLTLLIIFPVSVFAFTKQGFYTIDDTGWTASSTPSGDVFVCSDCGDLVQVLIAYGADVGSDSQYKNNEQFMAAFSTDQKKREFAEMLVKGALPMEGFDVNIIRVNFGNIGYLKALQYSASVKMPDGNESMETTLIAMHKNRIIKFTANFYKGRLSGESAIKLDKFHKSIKLL